MAILVFFGLTPSEIHSKDEHTLGLSYVVIDLSLLYGCL